MISRRQLIATVGALFCGSRGLKAGQQQKKAAKPALATVTLIIDGMT